MHKSLNLIIVAAALLSFCRCNHRAPTVVGNVDIYEDFPPPALWKVGNSCYI